MSTNTVPTFAHGSCKAKFGWRLDAEGREVIDKQVRLMHDRDIWARPDNG